MAAWSRSVGIYLSEDSEKIFITCPWQSGHTGSSQKPADSVIYLNRGDGYPQFFCYHNSCTGRDIGSLVDHYTIQSFTPFLQASQTPPPTPSAEGLDQTSLFLSGGGTTPSSAPAASTTAVPDISDSIQNHIQFLGCTRENDFVVHSADGHFPVFFSAKDVTHKWLLSLYSSETAWLNDFPKYAGNKCVGIDVEAAAQWLFKSCKEVGCFANRNFNELGLWLDSRDGTACNVINLGNAVYCDSTRYGYEQANSIFSGYYMPMESKITLSDTMYDSTIVVDQLNICRKLSFVNQDSAFLFLGGTYAQMCPSLSNIVPIIELIGPSASGKTMILKTISRQLILAGGGIHLTGGSTTAGTMQSINGNVSCILDEHEPNSIVNQSAIDGINDVALSATTGGASISKGTKQQRAIKRSFQCGFTFASVGNCTDKKETLSRRTLSISLVVPDDDHSTWSAKEKEIQRCFTQEKCRCIYRFIVDNISLIQFNVDKILTYISQKNTKINLAAANLYAIPAAYVVTLLSRSEFNIDRDGVVIDMVTRSLTEAYMDKSDKSEISFDSFIEKLLTLKIRDCNTDLQLQEMLEGGYDSALARCGIKIKIIDGQKMLLLANNHHVLTKMFEESGIFGYSSVLKSMMTKVKVLGPEYFLKVYKRCKGILFSDFIKDAPKEIPAKPLDLSALM